jgi:hypothetical protein
MIECGFLCGGHLHGRGGLFERASFWGWRVRHFSRGFGYWFPKDERSLAAAVFDSAAKFAGDWNTLAGSLVGISAGDGIFAATGFISLLYFALSQRPAKSERDHFSGKAAEVHRQGFRSEESTKAAKGAPLGCTSATKVCGLALGFASYNYTLSALNWLPLIFPPRIMSTCFIRRCIPVSFVRDAHRSSRRRWLVDALIQRGWNPVRVRQVHRRTICGLGILGAARAHDPAAALSGSAFLSNCPQLRLWGGRFVADCSARKRWHTREF